MQRTKFLSAKSPALVKMEIKPSQMEYKKYLKVLAQITNFKWESSKAEVVNLFNQYRYHNNS